MVDAVDSGTYTPETIARRRKLAEQLLGDSMSAQPIRSWAQGAAQLGRAAIGGYMGYSANEDEKAGRAAALAQALQGLGVGGGGGAAPAPPMSLAPGGTSDAGAPPPPNMAAITPGDPSLPRGLRNNNPLNIEAGSFTQGQPGFAGSDGRFAKFATPEAGIGAANSLLDTYQNKHGLNTVAGIVGRWAPAGDGNNVSAYAQAVAGKLGIDPNAPIPPQMRPALIAAMGQHENGRSIGNVAAALQGGAPSAGPQVAGPIPTPDTAVPPQPPQQMAGGPMPPQGPQGPAGAPPQPMAQPAPQNNRAAIAAMLNPWTPPALQGALAGQLNPSYGFQTLPDGTIIRTNPKTGTVEPIYSAPVKPELKEGGTDPITGQKTFLEYDPKTRTMRPLGADGGASVGQSGFLAKGISQVDHSLTGEDYLKQFGPEVQSAVRAYINGDVMPSGNPRQQAIAAQAKSIAQKYGQDTGTPVSDTLYAAKRKMQTDLASSTPNSTGGILSNGKSAFDHLGEASAALANQGNYSSSFPLGGNVAAETANYLGNKLGSSANDAKVKASSDALMKYGQESTKFYAGSGGGEGERMAALKNVNPATTSGEGQASFVETEKNLMLDRLRQKEAQIRDVMGEQYLAQHPVFTPALTSAIAKIDDNIAKLRGGVPAETQNLPATEKKTINGKNYFKQGDKWYEE